MKKLLVSLLVLAMCAPALAVTFSTADGGDGKLIINYALTAGEGIRGLALTLDGASVANATTGHSFAPFNTFVDYAFDAATYNVGEGHPFADKLAAGVATLPSNSLSICLGYLDQAGAQAAVTTSGSIEIQFDSSADTTVTVALDTLRGGVVGDGLVATAGLPASQLLEFADEETIVGTPVVAKTTAAPAVADKVNGGRTETFVASGVSGSLGGTLEYQFNWGDGSALVWGPATQTHVYTYGGGTTLPIYTTAPTFTVTVQARLAAQPTVLSAVSANYVVSAECIKSTATFYAAWAGAPWNRPVCWGYKKQCNGDINGLSSLGKPVTIADLNIFKAAYDKTDAVLATVTNGICADLNHAASLGKRVTIADLNTFKGYYDDAEATVPICPITNYHFWTK